MTIRTYVLVDRSGSYVSEEMDTLEEAKDEAEDRGHVAVVEFQYEFTDSELVWTPDGSNIWPS